MNITLNPAGGRLCCAWQIYARWRRSIQVCAMMILYFIKTIKTSTTRQQGERGSLDRMRPTSSTSLPDYRHWSDCLYGTMQAIQCRALLCYMCFKTYKPHNYDNSGKLSRSFSTLWSVVPACECIKQSILSLQPVLRAIFLHLHSKINYLWGGTTNYRPKQLNGGGA